MNTFSSNSLETESVGLELRADDPAIQASRVVNEAVEVPRFGDNRWSLESMESDDTRKRNRLNFEVWPDAFRELAKEYAYGLINYGTPRTLIEQASYGAWSSWPSPSTIQRSLADLKRAVDWFTGEWSDRHPDTPVVTPADLDTGHFDDLRQWIATESLTNKTIYDTLDALRRVWHMAPLLSPQHRWPAPNWMMERSLKRRVEENQTTRVAQSTMAPLITWACAFVEDFADDILAAHEHYADAVRDIPVPSAFSKQDCLDVLALYPDRRLPGQSYHRQSGTARVAWQVLEYRHRVSKDRMATAFFRLPDKDSYSFTDDPRMSSIDLVPSGKLRGRVWIDSFSVLDVCPRGRSGQQFGSDRYSALTTHLLAACVIVVSYLTGARPEEVLGLEFGAAKPPVVRPDGGRVYRIDGRCWKGRRRDEVGKPTDPLRVEWATIPVAWKAIGVAERLRGLYGYDSGLLFTKTGRVTRSESASKWITEFIDFVNHRLVPLSEPAATLHIPPDADGTITLRRLRRTLAWFLSNQPGGEVTLAIQYQHLRTTMASGYAGTKGSGMASLMRDEDWAHRRETITQLGHMLATGESIHGPGANRALTAVSRLPQHLTPSEERQLKKDPDLVLYDNPSAIALCAYQASTALCIAGTANENQHPRLDRCESRCGNLARTGKHLLQISKKADALRAHAAISPGPIANSMIDRAEQLDQLVQETHTQPKAKHD